LRVVQAVVMGSSLDVILPKQVVEIPWPDAVSIEELIDVFVPPPIHTPDLVPDKLTGVGEGVHRAGSDTQGLCGTCRRR
jgi:hypothetical protein